MAFLKVKKIYIRLKQIYLEIRKLNLICNKKETWHFMEDEGKVFVYVRSDGRRERRHKMCLHALVDHHSISHR